MSAASTAHGSDPDPDRDLGSTLQLGSDYEKKKQKLLQELQLDYRTYIAKQNNLKTREPHVQQQGLSLPINERTSMKERLREERKKEYNLFLQDQAQNRRLKRETHPISSEPEQFQESPSQGSPQLFLHTQTNTSPPHKQLPASRTDAAALTETGGNGRWHNGTWSHGPWGQRRRQIYKSEELHEEELSSDEEENFDFRHRRKQDRCTQVPEYKEKKRTRKHRLNRAFQDLKEAEAPFPHDQNNDDGILKSASKGTRDGMRTAVRSTPVTRKDEAEFATGLMIGTAEDQTVTQMKKEQYKQELLRQIAEQQRNKLKEKRHELKVAATGATNPEKQVLHSKQFRVAHQQYEDVRRDESHRSGINLEAVRKDSNPRHEDDNPLENTPYRAPQGDSQVGNIISPQPGKTVPGPGKGKTQDVPSFDFFSEDYHRDLMRMPEAVAVPRVSPPVIPDTHQAPYGAAHHYNKTRNPLENLLGGTQQSQMPPPVRADEAPPFVTERLHVDKQRRESVLSYQEALKQQIKEREEQKRREKEEKEQADAKLEAAMLAYVPWGRSGGGAPIKDQNGNLVSDLKQMHRINNDRTSAAKEVEAPLSHQLPDSNYCPPSQQLSTKDRYKDELKQQIEENRRRQAEEQKRIKMEEEEEEERLTKERARILQAYEEEQRKQKSIKKKQIHEAETHHRVEVKRTNNQSAKEREKKTSQLTYQSQQREPSPPVPTLQKKHVAPLKPPPDVSQLSSRAERSVSAPHVQPVPTAVPTPNDDQREVIKRLSAFRNYLRKEQKQMQLHMDQTETRSTHLDRRQPRTDAFEFVIKDGVQSSADCGGAEKQNQRRSNQPNHRDVLDYRPTSCYYSQKKPGRFIPTEASLPSETVFIGREDIFQQGTTRPLEERWERTASRRKQVYEEDADSIDRREKNDQLDFHSLKLWRARATDQNTRQPTELDYNRSEGMSGDEVPSSRSTQRRPISMETTERWLHPGTSETVKHAKHRRKPNSRLDALPWLT